MASIPKLTVLAVGRTKRDWLREGIADYADRLQHYTKFSYLELRDSEQKKEGADILKRAEGTLLVALAPGGKSLSSEQLAQWLSKQNRPLTFAIGSEQGLPEAVLQRADFTLSLSAMTLPHELCRIFLLEQLYRAATILKGEKYHR